MSYETDIVQALEQFSDDLRLESTHNPNVQWIVNQTKDLIGDLNKGLKGAASAIEFRAIYTRIARAIAFKDIVLGSKSKESWKEVDRLANSDDYLERSHPFAIPKLFSHRGNSKT